jgi:hypothetical protein
MIGIPNPWGGRFKLPAAKKQNILNLFDLAVELPPEEKKKIADSDEDDV